MYRKEREQIRENIDKGISTGSISAEKHIVVFGAGDYSREIIGYLRRSGIETDHVFDNDTRKIGSYCCGVRIVSPDNSLIQKDGMFIICSYFGNEMQAQLIRNGVSEEQIIRIILDSFGYSFKNNLLDLFKGKKLYRKIAKEYPGKKVLLCPYTGTGDIYLIGTLLQQYLQKNQIIDYVLVVVSKPCAMVADIFMINNVKVIGGPEECRCLMRYYMLCPDECKLTILNDSWADVYTNPVQYIRGLHGMHFTEMFRRFVFYLDENAKPEHPAFKNVDSELDKIFSELDLHAGRTVILAPYATTLADMPASFWENVAGWLLNRGFDVCTNCGSPDEKEVEGTKRLFFPLNIAPQLIERAGYFIGIRSGFCDVISGAKAKKIILYDKANYFFNCSAYDYFSLRKMGLSDDAIEIEYDNTLISELEEEVKKKII